MSSRSGHRARLSALSLCPPGWHTSPRGLSPHTQLGQCGCSSWLGQLNGVHGAFTQLPTGLQGKVRTAGSASPGPAQEGEAWLPGPSSPPWAPHSHPVPGPGREMTPQCARQRAGSSGASRSRPAPCTGHKSHSRGDGVRSRWGRGAHSAHAHTLHTQPRTPTLHLCTLYEVRTCRTLQPFTEHTQLSPPLRSLLPTCACPSLNSDKIYDPRPAVSQLLAPPLAQLPLLLLPQGCGALDEPALCSRDTNDTVCRGFDGPRDSRFLFYKKPEMRPGMAAHPVDPSTREADAGVSPAGAQSEPLSKTPTRNKVRGQGVTKR